MHMVKKPHTAAASAHLRPGSAAAMPHASPAFTIGGSSAAEIATPTRLLLLSDSTDSATPAPDADATMMPVRSVGLPVREDISWVGKSLGSLIQGVEMRPPCSNAEAFEGKVQQ